MIHHDSPGYHNCHSYILVNHQDVPIKTRHVLAAQPPLRGSGIRGPGPQRSTQHGRHLWLSDIFPMWKTKWGTLW